MEASSLRTVPLDDIRIGDDRLRAVGDLEALRESIASNGLLHPVVLDRSLRLVCGLHRVEACRALGWTEIPAVVLPLDGPRARLAEVDENLCRRELTVLERAEHIALRRRLWEEMNPAPPAPEGKKGRKAKAPDPPLAAFVDDTARRTGRAKTVVREELRIGELPEDVRATARETSVRDSRKELLALTRMPEEEQRAAISAVRTGAAKSVRKRVEKLPPAPEAEGDDACPFDLEGAPAEGQLLSDAARDPSGHRDDPMSPWATPGGGLERELGRAQIVRLVGEAQRSLARVLELWPEAEGDAGRRRAEEALEAAQRLAAWVARSEGEADAA